MDSRAPRPGPAEVTSEAAPVEATESARDLDELLNDHFNQWLKALRAEAEELDYQDSLSWRITKPLRYGDAFVTRVRQDGWLAGFAAAFAFLRRKR